MACDGVLGNLGPVGLVEVGDDLAMGETFGRQRQHQLIHAVEAALAFMNHRRFERAVPTPGYVDLDRPDIGQDRLSGV